jgi:hypothetical protein
MKTRYHAGLAIIVVVLLCGCALTYQTQGRRGVLGFAWVEHRTEDGCEQGLSLKLGKATTDHITPVIHQKTLGLYLDVSENSPGLGFGYRDLVIVAPAADADTNLEYDTSNPMNSSYTVVRKKEALDRVTSSPTAP